MSKVGSLLGSDVAATADSQERAAARCVQSHGQTDAALCARGCVGTRWLERPVGASPR